jgi:hypothetical protein
MFALEHFYNARIAANTKVNYCRFVLAFIRVKVYGRVTHVDLIKALRAE